MSEAILYLDAEPGGRIQAASLAGIRRYAQSLRWNVVDVPPADSRRPANISVLLAAHHPVAGCVVDGSGGRRNLPPRLFGEVPVVYMHTEPSLYGGRGMRVGYDDAAIAEAAFRELSAGQPAAFAVVPFDWPPGRRGWALRRERAFAALAATSGKPCFRMPWRKEPKERRETRLVRWLATLPRHTAIFAVGDMAAAETAAAAKLCHRSIPRELTLLGIDNDPALCEASRPTLSSIQIDHELAGYLAAKAITAAMPPPLEIAVRPLLAVRRESTGGRGRHEPLILAAVETIRREACDGLTAADLAARFPGSRSLFQLRFREAMGHSVLDEILHVRLEKVLTLLSQTDTAIGAISGLCGFRTDRALDSLFHSRFGMSMQEWRRRNGRVRP